MVNYHRRGDHPESEQWRWFETRGRGDLPPEAHVWFPYVVLISNDQFELRSQLLFAWPSWNFLLDKSVFPKNALTSTIFLEGCPSACHILSFDLDMHRKELERTETCILSLSCLRNRGHCAMMSQIEIRWAAGQCHLLKVRQSLLIWALSATGHAGNSGKCFHIRRRWKLKFMYSKVKSVLVDGS